MSTVNDYAGNFTIDPAHSEIGFTARHAMVTKVRGSFNEFSGTATSGENLADAAISVTIAASSLDTRNADRDGHVKSEDFFDVEKFPTMTFTSTGFDLGEGEGTITGELTIKGVTKTVELETEFNGVVVDAFGMTRAGFEAQTTISRKEFGLTWNAAIEAGGVLVSDKVVITLDAAFVAPQA